MLDAINYTTMNCKRTERPRNEASAVSSYGLYIPGVLAVLASSSREGDEESRHESGELHFVGLVFGEQNESVLRCEGLCAFGV